MLTVICGEDTIASRNYFSKLKDEYKAKGYEIQSIAPSEIIELQKNDTATITLFGSTKVYTVENAQSAVTRSKKGGVSEALKEIANNAEIILIDWENGRSLRETSIAKLGKSEEFKPSSSIFGLVDACYPGNRKGFISLMHNVSQSQDEGFIFSMLARHIRLLLLSSSNALPTSTPPWQKGKLYAQAKKWEPNKLAEFYTGLSRIDTGLKTSSNTHGYVNSIDILSCYFL